jgi:hypothetical protein
MQFIHLYELGTDTWVAQFTSIAAAKKYCAKVGRDINEFEIKYGPSKYAK